MHKVYRKICLIIPKTPILISDLLINVIFVVFSHDDSHKVKKRSKKDLYTSDHRETLPGALQANRKHSWRLT